MRAGCDRRPAAARCTVQEEAERVTTPVLRRGYLYLLATGGLWQQTRPWPAAHLSLVNGRSGGATDCDSALDETRYALENREALGFICRGRPSESANGANFRGF